MREAKHPGSDKYFRARGNYEATKRGEGGQAAAEAIRLVLREFTPCPPPHTHKRLCVATPTTRPSRLNLRKKSSQGQNKTNYKRLNCQINWTLHEK